MSDYDFEEFERYNDTVAAEGVYFEIIDEQKRSWGEFLCRYDDEKGEHAKRNIARIRIKYAKEIRTDSLESRKDELALDTLLSSVLIGWRGVKNKKGKEVPYSADAARAFFSRPKALEFAVPKLLEYAKDPVNFGAPDVEEVTGN